MTMIKAVATLPDTKDGSTFSTADIELILDYAFSHRKVVIQNFLRERRIAVSGTKEEIQNRVTQSVANGHVSVDDLLGLLDEISGWGNQHVYLYSAPANKIAAWKHQAHVETQLKSAGFAHLLNCRLSLFLPETATLSSIEWSPKRVRFVWVERRDWQSRMPEKDKPKNANGISFKAYQDRVARGITSFDWNLVSGEAALLIQTLPSGENYDELRQQFETELSAVLQIKDFTRRRIRAAIKKIEKSKEALNRKIELETRTGAQATYTSKSRKTDAYADPDVKNSRDALGTRTTSRGGNFYFQPATAGLERTIHIKLYAKDERVGISGECTEREVQYVLSRVRHHCG